MKGFNPPALHWPRWTLLMPKLAVGLLVLSLISLLWLLHRNEVEEQRNGLIADILWLDQNFHFHLSGNEDLLVQLGVDMGNDANPRHLFQVRAQHLVKNNPEVEQVFWLNAAGAKVDAVPAATEGRQELKAFGGPVSQDTFDFARKLAKSAYAEPYPLPEHGTQIDLFVPIYRQGEFAGMLVASYSLNSILTHLVPWWFAEKYQLQVLDDDGKVLASKSNIQGEPGLDYAIPFDPPGHGLMLQGITYRTAGNPAQMVLAGAIILLALAVFWSLWAIRGLIKKRLMAEQALREEHAFRKAMEDSIIIGMRARDMAGGITYVNPAFCRMSGYSAEELVGQTPPLPYWDKDYLDMHEEQNALVLAGGAPNEGFESRIRHKDGHIVNTMTYATPLINAEGRQTGWISSVVDITERKKAQALQRQQEEKLEQTARLVTMGEMASTLAHELNQPLSAIASYTTGCLNRLESGDYTGDELAGALRKLAQQAQRAGRIIRQVHDFVRKREPHRVVCGLEEIIEDSVAFIEPLARKQQVRLLRLLPPHLPHLLADPVLLGQVLINLMRNGIDAMAVTPPDRRQLVVEAEVQGDHIEVCIGDRGSGIAPEVAEKIFTPFFTTKAEGMGMGLNICRSVIEFHGGRLWFEPGAEGG
ncbi:MAG: PAS domain S-box protein, partial [Betaproteobacteria bacterium]|nr:PAS domain S-box protein [Betaproteobacteria bacterium]